MSTGIRIDQASTSASRLMSRSQRGRQELPDFFGSSLDFASSCRCRNITRWALRLVLGARNSSSFDCDLSHRPQRSALVRMSKLQGATNERDAREYLSGSTTPQSRGPVPLQSRHKPFSAIHPGGSAGAGGGVGSGTDIGKPARPRPCRR